MAGQKVKLGTDRRLAEKQAETRRLLRRGTKWFVVGTVATATAFALAQRPLDKEHRLNVAGLGASVAVAAVSFINVELNTHRKRRLETELLELDATEQASEKS